MLALEADSGFRAMPRIDDSLIGHGHQFFLDAVDQHMVAAAGEIGAPDAEIK